MSPRARAAAFLARRDVQLVLLLLQLTAYTLAIVYAGGSDVPIAYQRF